MDRLTERPEEATAMGVLTSTRSLVLRTGARMEGGCAPRGRSRVGREERARDLEERQAELQEELGEIPEAIRTMKEAET